MGAGQQGLPNHHAGLPGPPDQQAGPAGPRRRPACLQAARLPGLCPGRHSAARQHADGPGSQRQPGYFPGGRFGQCRPGRRPGLSGSGRTHPQLCRRQKGEKPCARYAKLTSRTSSVSSWSSAGRSDSPRKKSTVPWNCFTRFSTTRSRQTTWWRSSTTRPARSATSCTARCRSPTGPGTSTGSPPPRPCTGPAMAACCSNMPNATCAGAAAVSSAWKPPPRTPTSGPGCSTTAPAIFRRPVSRTSIVRATTASPTSNGWLRRGRPDMETWQKILQASITDPAAVTPRFGIDPNPLQEVAERYPMRITPYYLSLIKEVGDPIWKQAVPDPQELASSICGADPLDEENQSPVPNLVHRYPD